MTVDSGGWLSGASRRERTGAPDRSPISISIPLGQRCGSSRSAREFITFGPERYRDSEFDIELLTLRWGGQDIDLTAAEDIRLFDRGAAVWREVPTDMKAFEIHQLMGRSAPVMSRETLVHYKRIIDRPVDRVDIEAVDHGGVKNRG